MIHGQLAEVGIKYVYNLPDIQTLSSDVIKEVNKLRHATIVRRS